MKNFNILLVATAFTAFAACDPEPELIDNFSVNQPDGTGFLYTLSEGQWNGNDSRLACYDLEAGRLKAWNNYTTYCAFEGGNDRLLGDGANDMILYGSKLYIAVSGSSTLEIADAATCRSMSQISIVNDKGEARQPRFMAANGKYVYLCCYDGTVSRIDTVSMQIDAVIQVGSNPDGIGVAGGKLYVSNSGGMNFADPDSTVSVVDLETFTETKRISVLSNPGQICTWENRVFVLTRGVYSYVTWSYDLHLQVIDSNTDKVEKTLDLPIEKMAIDDGRLWYYESGGRVSVIDVSDYKTIDADFIKDGTVIKTPYGICPDALHERVYVTDAGDYVTPGRLLCFEMDGRLLYEVKGVGVCPNKVVRY
ncbi:MAG: hypothetical protein MJY58_04900 [Bacteroidaceae bacterium]|nr:hypothetical protein [Bacteroidaceae bacterium]